jgi:hypothetical protein
MQDSVLATGVVAPLATRALQHQVGALTAAQPDLRLGIDIGSVSAKVVILDRQGTTVFSAYRRHRAETTKTLRSLLEDAAASLGDIPVTPLITQGPAVGTLRPLQGRHRLLADGRTVPRQRHPRPDQEGHAGGRVR